MKRGLYLLSFVLAVCGLFGFAVITIILGTIGGYWNERHYQN